MDDSVSATGQPAEFLRLFLANEADLKAYVGALIREPAAREDVFQEIALTLWQTFERYDSRRSFGGWARGVATNKILHARRKNARLPLAFSPEAIQAVQEAWDRSQDGAEADHRRNQARALEECVAELPERSARIVAMHYSDRSPAASIAARLGTSADAIYQSLTRIRSQLAACVQRRMRRLDD